MRDSFVFFSNYRRSNVLNISDKETTDLVGNIFAIASLTLINAGWSPIQTLTIELYPTVVR